MLKPSLPHQGLPAEGWMLQMLQMLHTGRRMYVKTGMSIGSATGTKTKLKTGTTTGMMSSVTTARSMFPRPITAAPPDSILGLNAAFLADPHPTKVNLTVGAYRDAAGRPWVFPSVQAASKRLADRVGESGLEYAPISGVPSFVELATDLLYGPTKAGMKDRLVSTQALSGTGALRLGMDVVCALRCGEDQDGDNRRVYLPAQTWGNHVSVVSAARLLPLTYPYARLDEGRGRRQNWVGGPQENLGTRLALDPGAMLHALDAAPRGSVVLLHACAHNPTGLDPDLGLWSQMSDIVLKRGLVPFFDVAYQGVASGSCEKDVEGLRLFVERGHTLLAAQSFAKNFGVYGERAGVLSIVTSSPSEATALRSQVQRIVRAAYSSPPIHGARLVSEVLGDSALKFQWERDLHTMVGRLTSMRQGLVTALDKLHPALALGVSDQRGMFAFLPALRPELVDRLRADYHVYMTRDGRVSLSGLNPSNLQYVADSIHSVVSV